MPATLENVQLPGGFNFQELDNNQNASVFAYIHSGQDVLSYEWKEHVQDEGPNQSAFETGDAHTVLVGDIWWLDLPYAVGQFLGYPKRVVSGSTPLLSRVLPLAHPRYPWMYATKISNVQPYRPFTRFLPAGNSETGSLPGVEGYARARLTVLFESLDYRLLSDSSLAAYGRTNGGGYKEWHRYVVPGSKASLDVLNVQNGVMKFAEGPGSPNIVPTGLNRLIPKGDFTFTWKHVPEFGLFVQDTQLPQKILNCVGRVNKDPFMGYEAETLLCLPPEFIPYKMPVDPSALGLAANEPARMYDVVFRLKYLRQPTEQLGNPLKAGHNLAPYGVDFKWWLVTSNGEADGLPLYQPTNFEQLFELN